MSGCFLRDPFAARPLHGVRSPEHDVGGDRRRSADRQCCDPDGLPHRRTPTCPSSADVRGGCEPERPRQPRPNPAAVGRAARSLAELPAGGADPNVTEAESQRLTAATVATVRWHPQGSLRRHGPSPKPQALLAADHDIGKSAVTDVGESGGYPTHRPAASTGKMDAGGLFRELGR